MVKRRAVALEEDEIVRRILHLQEDTDRVTACRDVVSNAAADRGVESRGLLDVCNRDLVVIEPACLGALVFVNIHIEAGLAIHAGADFERRSANIERVQCTALKRALDPLAW